MKIFWKEIIDVNAIAQLENCMIDWAIGVMTADAHYGYSMPVWGCIAYPNHISLSGVGFDIGCGNKAVKTNIKVGTIDIAYVMEMVRQEIGFWLGRPNPEPVDHIVLHKIKNANFAWQRQFYDMAVQQLGTVWSGNHYVDIFEWDDWYIWIGVHFWSRWFWHKTTTWFIALSQGWTFNDHWKEWAMDSKPILFDMNTELWQSYFEAMSLAGEYAYAGRDIVCNKVLEILWGISLYEVHNHHNFARKEKHFGNDYYVVRKWCTPAFPWQLWFIGSNMFDTSVIVEWVDSEESKLGLYSTVHWAGRIMWRRVAAGSWKRKDGERVQVKEWLVNFENTKQKAKENWVYLVWAWADESPECYKNLSEVLKYQWDTIKVLHTLKPIWVAMAWHDIYDPYKD